MRIGSEVVGRRALGVLLGAALGVAVAACRGDGGTPRRNATAGANAASARPGAERADERGRVLFVGTSLTAGLGLDPSQAYPALVAAKIDSAGLPFEVVNAGVSGETSAGALQRIGWLLRDPADVLVLETGANDGLRGVPVAEVRANIQAILDSVRARRPGTRVLLVQMEAPPNFGPQYTTAFHAMYPALAKANGVTLVPFLLDGVAGVPRLNQADGIHPTAEGARVVARTVWGALEPVLEAVVAAEPERVDAAAVGQ